MTVSPQRFANVLSHQRRRWYRSLRRIILLFVVVSICFFQVDLLNQERLISGVPSLFRLIGEMLPPDFSLASHWVEPLMDTLVMSIAGTAIAVMMALPLALCAAPNTTPHPIVYFMARGSLNLARAIPELILGMVLVAAFGFGKLPGTLALGLHSIGMVGKFIAEAIELTDQAPIEATRAVGATETQIIIHSVLPQILPQMIDVSFYRWEYNFRASVVLGAVGAGGIGAELISALRILKYEQVAALFMVILVMVTLVDSCSNYLRQRFV